VTDLEPGFHATRGWLNDPHGVVHHDGRYHLFFQHVPDAVTWRPGISWGHAVSVDLERWTELPVALAPEPGELGCWTGCVVDGPAILYTSVSEPHRDRGRVRAARPVGDDLLVWTRDDLVLEPPDGAEVFRDPFVLRDGDRWRMVVGGSLAGVGTAFTFVSDDLRSWAYDGVLAAGDGTTGVIWECPQLVDVDGVTTLVVSVHDGVDTRHVAAACGELAGGRFTCGPWQVLTDGAPYAPTAFRDLEGRLVLVFWLRGVTGDGWAGALSAPYLLGRNGDRLVLERRPVRG
jgi:beta-fructofuranosidase